MTTFRSTLPRRIARFVLGAVLLLAPVQYARAEVVTPPPPSLGTTVTITPASAYPRGVPTNWTIQVTATEGATFTTSASAPDVPARFTSCDLACSMTTQGAVSVPDDGDATPRESVTMVLTGTATPALNIPLRSTEGQPMQPSPRQLTVTLTPTGTTTGPTVTKSAPLPVTVNMTTQSVIELTTTAPPTEPIVAVRGGTVPYRATVTRTGNSAQETSINIRLVPGTEGISGTVGPANALVFMAPGVNSVTVQLSAQVPLDAPEGIATWRLQATWNSVDVEVGLPRSFSVPPAPPAPPAPAPTPAAVPVPMPVAPAPEPVVDPPVAAAVAKPVDTTKPAVGVQLLSGTRILVAPGARPRFPMRYTCPKTEKSCVMRAVVSWRPKGGKRVQLGMGVLRLKGGASGRSTFLLTPRARTLLRRYGVLRVLLVVTATDAAGNVATGKLPVVLKLTKTRRPR